MSSKELIRLKYPCPVEFPLQLNVVWVLWSFISSLSPLPAEDRRSFALEQGNCDKNLRKWVLTSLISDSCDSLSKCQAGAEVLTMLCVVSYNPGFMWKAEGWSSFSSLGCSTSNCLFKSLFSSEKSPENGKTEFSCNTVITFCQIAFNFHLLPLCLLLHLILGLFLWKLQNRLCLKNGCRGFELLVSWISSSTYFSNFCNLWIIHLQSYKLPTEKYHCCTVSVGATGLAGILLPLPKSLLLELSLSDLCFCSFASVGDLLCLCRHMLWVCSLDEYCMNIVM